MYIIERLEEILSETGITATILKADSFKKAQKLFYENRPGVVLLDIFLPGQKSFDLLKEIKKSGKQTSVIVLAIDMDKYVLDQCKLLGADFFFDKYNEFEKIPAVIESIFERN